MLSLPTRLKPPFPRLNVGSGPNTLENFTNLDRTPYPGVNHLWEYLDSFPYDDQSFEEINASHFIEHIQNTIKLMNEFHRILKPSGLLVATVPWFNGEWAHGDPTHVRFFDHNSFNPFSDWYDRYAHLGITGRWKKLSQTYHKHPNYRRERFLREAHISPILAMTVTLERADP